MRVVCAHTHPHMHPRTHAQRNLVSPWTLQLNMRAGSYSSCEFRCTTALHVWRTLAWPRVLAFFLPLHPRCSLIRGGNIDVLSETERSQSPLTGTFKGSAAKSLRLSLYPLQSEASQTKVGSAPVNGQTYLDGSPVK